MIKRNGRHSSQISSVVTKGLNTDVNVIFQFFLCNAFAKMCKILFWLCHYGVLRGKRNLNNFSIRLQHKNILKSEGV